jgi:hypothetical protein
MSAIRRVSYAAQNPHDVISSCAGGSHGRAFGRARRNPWWKAAAKRSSPSKGLRFRDLDGDGKLTPYEDWRLSPNCARPLLPHER